jgi:hypothetical protein
MFALSVACLVWMRRTVRLLDAAASPRTSHRLEQQAEAAAR